MVFHWRVFLIVALFSVSGFANKQNELIEKCFQRLVEAGGTHGSAKFRNMGARPFTYMTDGNMVLAALKLTENSVNQIAVNNLGDGLYGAKALAYEVGSEVIVIFWPGEGKVSHRVVAMNEAEPFSEKPLVAKAWGFQLTAEFFEGRLKVTEIHIDSSLTAGYRKPLPEDTLKRGGRFLRAVFDAIDVKSDDCEVFFLNGKTIDPEGVVAAKSGLDVRNNEAD